MLKLLLCLIFAVAKLHAKDYDQAVIQDGYARIKTLKDKYYKKLYKDTADARKSYNDAVKSYKAGESSKLVKKANERLKVYKSKPKSSQISA